MSAMKKQKENVSKEEIRLTISSMNGLGENSGKIPVDLIDEILSRLPAKSVARFHCVSKNWNSLLHTPYFTNLFMTRSSACLRLLFTFQTEGNWSFFSTPQSLISNHNSSLVVVDKHMEVPRDYSFGICVPVCGILCTKDEWIYSRRRDSRMMICNPSTGQCISLPKVKTRRGQVITYFGYDPIEGQFKVLCMTVCERPFLYKAEEHQVLTLETGKLKWRMIECSVDHYPQSNEICFNGVLYYLAVDKESRKTLVVCFDVRSEKFNFIMNKGPEDICARSTLINYKGKLGVIQQTSCVMDGSSTSFDLWVIDDSEEHNWSRHTHILPPLWKNVLAETKVYIVGMIGTSEIVFSPYILSDPFCIFHLDIERNSIRRVEIQGIGPLEGQNIYTFVNHVENVKQLIV